MIDRKALDSVYRQELEKNIIIYLVEKTGVSYERAMDAYYRSKLTVQIGEGKYGIDNLDYKYLAQDLMENEPELLCG